jgi:hypothetical protein
LETNVLHAGDAPLPYVSHHQLMFVGAATPEQQIAVPYM